MNEKKISTSTIAMIALMTAVTCILGPLSVPIGPVPISLTNLAIYFTVILLGWKKGTVSYVIYLLIGLVGVPVFSSFSAGPAKLFGPTGGYLIGFIFLAMISGWFIEKFPGKRVMYFVGVKMAEKPADEDHPFGHGRIEYVSGLVVAAAILLMGYELVRDSIGKIMHPEETEFTLLVAVILIASILVKLYMAYYNRAIGKKLDSAAMKAVATDSLSDTAATTVVLLASVFTHFTGIKIDGYCGLVVGLLVGYAGFDAARETLNPLLGQPPAHEFVEKIDEIVMSHSEVCGMHDLIVHDYGPGRQMISLHAEVPAEGNILELHDVIDNIENELRETLGCEATIHMDPVVTSDEHVSETKAAMVSLIKAIDEDLSIHDFRMVSGGTHTNLIFDILAPFGFRLTDEELLTEVLQSVHEHFGDNYYVVTKIDHSYI